MYKRDVFYIWCIESIQWRRDYSEVFFTSLLLTFSLTILTTPIFIVIV